MAETYTSAEVSEVVRRSRRRKFLVTWFWKIIALAILAGIGVFIVFPAVWMISTSLKTNAQLYTDPPTWIPRPAVWANFTRAWVSVDFTRYTINTALYALAVVFGTLLSNSLIAYGFARLRFPGRDLLFGVVLGTMMIPGMVTMIPQYIMFAKLHWIGSYLPLVVPAFFGSSYYIFLLRQFFMGVPQELSEAARIDGANELWIWWKVVVPLSKAAMATVALFTFEGAWNDYVGPVLYLSDPKLYTVQVGLSMFRSTSDVNWQHIMAASLLIMIPTVVLFASFQRYFVEGAAVSGIKG